MVQRLNGSCPTPRWVGWLNLSLAAVLFLTGSAEGADVTNADGSPTQPWSGGACTYRRYRGRADVVSIRPATMPGSGAPSYATREVLFVFHPDEQIREAWVQVDGRRFLLTLDNGRYPGPAFMAKYGIDVGSRLDCELALITSGTCTPMRFEFPTIDLADYFEHGK